MLLLPSQADLAEFLAAHQVEIVASLPYYLEQQTDAQRGAGVFAKSIEALRKLNALGYGHEGSGLRLNLVYNPVGAFLPPAQRAIEADFKRELARRHGIVFNSLYTITNMPISRFLEFLLRSGNYDRYMDKLVERLQSGGRRGRDVPLHAFGRLGRHAVRLRLQPDARSAAWASARPRTSATSTPALLGRPPHHRRAALLRMHGRQRVQLRRRHHSSGPHSQAGATRRATYGTPRWGSHLQRLQ